MEKITLPFKTNRTISGPIIHIEKPNISLKYDYEQDNADIIWTEILFKEALACEYRQAVSAQVGDVIKSDIILILDNSGLLKNIVNAWDKQMGMIEIENVKGGRKRFKHYKIWFDDSSSLDIIASNLVFVNSGKK